MGIGWLRATLFLTMGWRLWGGGSGGTGRNVAMELDLWKRYLSEKWKDV